MSPRQPVWQRDHRQQGPSLGLASCYRNLQSHKTGNGNPSSHMYLQEVSIELNSFQLKHLIEFIILIWLIYFWYLCISGGSCERQAHHRGHGGGGLSRASGAHQEDERQLLLRRGLHRHLRQRVDLKHSGPDLWNQGKQLLLSGGHNQFND